MAAAPPSPTSSSRSMDRLSVDSTTGEPNQLPSPLRRVTPKVLFAPHSGCKFLWLDFVFLTGEAMEDFERISQKALSGTASFYRLQPSRPNPRFAGLRITSEFKKVNEVLIVVFEHFPFLFKYLDKKMSKQS